MAAIASMAKLAVAASILMLVVSLGMKTTFADATSFFRKLFEPPRSLLRASFAINVVVPTIAATVAGLFTLPQAVEVALIAMAISPVPPILPGKTLKFGGRASYVFGLLVAVSLTSVVLIPLTVEIIGRLFHREAHIGPTRIAIMVARTVLVPLAVGIVIRQMAPQFADRTGEPIGRLAFLLLIAGLLPMVFVAAPGMWSLIGNGSILAIAAVVTTAIAAGQWIGGPAEGDRTALGITSAMRHPGIALTIATTNFPDNPLMPAAILLYLLAAVVATTIYGNIRLPKGAGREEAEANTLKGKATR